MRVAPASQARVLDDGVITNTEYRDSVKRTVTCMQNAGYSVPQGPRTAADGRLTWSYATPRGDVQRASSTYWGCYNHESRLVERLFLGAIPSQDDQSAVREQVRQCLIAHGVAIGTNPATADLVLAALAVTDRSPETGVVDCINRPGL